ncbi:MULTISPECIES: hypothetical protein [Methanoculleus]|uniref:Uncharacterized protein n=1 Tax=Methanoculleus thermophilus TaxID=2200 RepID=A0A1G9B8J6_9EURY|nr:MULTISPECIES: hypothetical protein [Methanoculleus]NLN09804.1 hypothetical protein [Methanoculleus thermophilus]SDK35882.1 hypothetical protein SAMN04488571_10864 [Methanoculleus thermophilus]HQD25904.1 hypothetical protein [Methanoculleus thermophilus]
MAAPVFAGVADLVVGLRMIAHLDSIGLMMVEIPISVTYGVPHRHRKSWISHGMGCPKRS